MNNVKHELRGKAFFSGDFGAATMVGKIFYAGPNPAINDRVATIYADANGICDEEGTYSDEFDIKYKNWNFA